MKLTVAVTLCHLYEIFVYIKGQITAESSKNKLGDWGLCFLRNYKTHLFNIALKQAKVTVWWTVCKTHLIHDIISEDKGIFKCVYYYNQ